MSDEYNCSVLMHVVQSFLSLKLALVECINNQHFNHLNTATIYDHIKHQVVVATIYMLMTSWSAFMQS